MTTTCIILIVIIASLAQINGETSRVKNNSMEVDKGPKKDSEDSDNEQCNRDLFNMFDMDHDGQITKEDLENCGKKGSEYMKIEIDGWDADVKRSILINMKDITETFCDGRMNFTFFNNEFMRFLETLDPLTSKQEEDVNLLRKFQLLYKESYTLEEVKTALNYSEDKIRERFGLIYGGLTPTIPREVLVRALKNPDHLPLKPIKEVQESINAGCSMLGECLKKRSSSLRERIVAKASEVKKIITKTVKKRMRKSVADNQNESGKKKKSRRNSVN